MLTFLTELRTTQNQLYFILWIAASTNHASVLEDSPLPALTMLQC